MSFWTPENLRVVLAGQWIRRPDAARTAALSGLSTDSRAIRSDQVFLALRGEKTDGHAYLASAAASGSPLLIVDDEAAVAAASGTIGADVGVLKVADTGQALLKLAQAYRRTLDSTRVIAVGGSNGKTTTVRLIQSVLSGTLRGTASQKSFNNAVGVPLTILSARKGDQFLICEVGTNAPGEIAPLASVVEPDIAVITSIGREHLEGLGSLDGVVAEEASLIGSLKPGGIAIVTADAPGLVARVRTMLTSMPGRSMLTFGTSPDADLRVTEANATPDGVRLCLNGRTWHELGLMGLHNATNAAAAIAVARRLGVDSAAIDTGLASASGPPMRLERSTVGGIRFVNDAYNANPESALAAIRAFGDAVTTPEARAAYGRRVVILGDMLELGEAAPDLHREVGEALAQVGWVDLVVLVGRLMLFASPSLAKTLGGERVAHVPDLDSGGAADVAAMLRASDVVLLKGSRGMRLERILEAVRTRTAESLLPGPEPKPIGNTPAPAIPVSPVKSVTSVTPTTPATPSSARETAR
jgi:UDP-N-acetylmuramoyl-tripeptide--D-alanyl-D-alanine ligase